ncbi:granulocyte colony-stimulating factor [Acomys russatus]|uniref:granulocyte colony-stimulating factor n=1 Tax=Acomys russatus TaxID=60746 RepID=UPI0021E207A1|nr:granulocyte colony-stimulating factor [Acomys russatus]
MKSRQTKRSSGHCVSQRLTSDAPDPATLEGRVSCQERQKGKVSAQLPAPGSGGKEGGWRWDCLSPVCLLPALQLLLWHSTLWSGQEAIPLASVSSVPPSPPLPRTFLLKSLEQVRKIQARTSGLLEQLCATYKLCHPEELVLLGHSLGIPQAPLSGCSSQALQLTRCLRQLHSGLFLYQGLLQALAGISPGLAPTLDMLQLDVANFATTVWQQMESLGVAPPVQATQSTMPTFTSAFQRRAGGVLATSHLQSFLELVHCALHDFAWP